MISCMKYIVIIYNFLFWLLGVVLLATTIFLYVDVQNYVNFEDTSELYMTPFLLFIALGAIMTLVGFLGCCGAIRESSCLLATYFLLCVTMCVACGAAVWWSMEHGDAIRDRLQKDIQKVVREKYGRGAPGAMESIVDKLQTDFQCCGVKGPQDWATSFYNSHNKSQGVIDFGIQGGGPPSSDRVYQVPESCCTEQQSSSCVRHRTEVTLGLTGLSGIHNDGCWDGIKRYVEEQWKWIIIVAVVVIGVQFFALLFACCLCCAISRGDDK